MRIATRSYNDEQNLAALERRLAARPDAVELLFERACCLEDLGRDEPASQAYVDVLRHDAHHLGALTNLGLLFLQRGELATARAFFTQSITHHPLSAIAHVNLGQVLLEQGEVQSAIRQYEAALHVDPDFFAAHHGLALLYEQLEDTERAQLHLRNAFAKRASWSLPFLGTGKPLRVLLLVSGRGGDIVSHPFLDDRVMHTTMFVPEGFSENAPLPPHDVIFNGIGDADRCATSLARARDLLAASPVATINDPARVLATGRASTAERLGALTGVVVPHTERIARDALTADGLRARGFTFPLLLRAPGFHAGRHFEFVADDAALAETAARVPGKEPFVIAFADTRSADGFFRKYRVLFIDGVLYPVHLAVSPEWKVHYFSAGMETRAEHRAEEARFLAGMPAVLGERAVAALTAIERALGLDYAGIDFALDANGDIVVFEANATMAVYPPVPGEMWAYRRPPYERVVAAVRAMIAARAA